MLDFVFVVLSGTDLVIIYSFPETINQDTKTGHLIGAMIDAVPDLIDILSFTAQDDIFVCFDFQFFPHYSISHLFKCIM